MKHAKLVGFWAAIVLLALFVILNFHKVQVFFGPFGDVNFPAAVIIFGSAALGFAIGRLWRRPPKS